MFIAVKDSKIISIQDTEWMCRAEAKGLEISEYNIWLKTVTNDEGISDYSGEDYTIENLFPVFGQTDIQNFRRLDYITSTIDGIFYHLKWDASKKEVVKDDTAKAAWELAEEWKRIRTERTRLLAETDWVVIKARENGGQVPAAWKTYRVALRDLPAEQSDKTKYSEITWPTQPS